MSQAGFAAERNAIAQAFVHELRAEARDRVQPTLKIRPPLPHDDMSADANLDDGSVFAP